MRSILEFLGLDNEEQNFDEKIYNSFLSPKSSISKLVMSNKIILNLSRKLLNQKTRIIYKKKFYKENLKPELELKYRKRIAKVFVNDVKNLEKLLNKKLPWNDF